MIEKKRILFILPRGEAIRNFVLSGTAKLIRENAFLIIVSVIPNKEIEVILRQNCDEFYELQEISVPMFIQNFWEWLDVVHDGWLWSGTAAFRWKLRDYEANSLKKKISRSVQKAFAFLFKNRIGLEGLTSFEKYYYKYLVPNKYFAELLETIKPDLVFNGSHIHSKIARPIVHAAKKLNIKTATFIFSWDNLTSQGRIIPTYNYYAVWNENIKRDLLLIYKKIHSKQVSVTGTPQFDFHFDKGAIWSKDEYCKKLGLDPTQPIILYTTGMLNLMPGEEIVVEEIADICVKLESKPQLVVRIYPKDSSGRFEQLKERRKDIIFPKIPWEPNFSTPMPDDIALFTNMLKHCDVGINVASTVSLELCMFNKPVINVGYNPTGVEIFPKDYSLYYQWEHYKPLTDSGAIDIAWSRESIPEIMSNAIEHPEAKTNERKELLTDFFGPYLDGKSYKRMADKLLEWAETL